MTTKRRETEVRRKQIIDAAREIIVKHGSENITIRRIAKSVGISEAAIYRHFKSKREILSFLIATMDETLEEEITQNTANGHSVLQSLYLIISQHISAIEQRRGIYFQVFAEIISLGDKKLNRQTAEVIDIYIRRLSELISKGIETGEMKKGLDPQTAATVLFSTIQGMVNIWAINNYSFNLTDKYQPLWDTFQSVVTNHKPTTLNS